MELNAKSCMGLLLDSYSPMAASESGFAYSYDPNYVVMDLQSDVDFGNTKYFSAGFDGSLAQCREYADIVEWGEAYCCQAMRMHDQDGHIIFGGFDNPDAVFVGTDQTQFRKSIEIEGYTVMFGAEAILPPCS